MGDAPALDEAARRAELAAAIAWAAANAAEEIAAERAAKAEAARLVAKEEAAKQTAEEQAAKQAADMATPASWFFLSISPGTVVAGVVAAFFAAVLAALSFTDRAVRDGMYFLAVVVAVLCIGYAAVSFVPIRPIGAFALVPCRPPSSSTIVYQTFDASVLVHAFDVSTGNETDGDVTVCVDTGADMLCLTSITNTRVLMSSSTIVYQAFDASVLVQMAAASQNSSDSTPSYSGALSN